ncbi:Molecular chaperone DnaK [Pseudomonas syringae pv. actinidiae]|uniref:Molecular chaperone DnaK n=1 Tax=Pseudomonas syringae pv. actinidiae TaxID=103796 RepID=A0AAN4Q0T3_PSESF|nr:Molecular chaperone DnaK [Pseudomonas syringae pv. actinidiae]
MSTKFIVLNLIPKSQSKFTKTNFAGCISWPKSVSSIKLMPIR